MDKPDWNALLQKALSIPGTLSKAYSVFHNYSLGNAILASIQLGERGLPLAPIASFNRWKELGRQVKKGEKALSLIMPVTMKRKGMDGEDQEESVLGTFMIFLLKRHWFSVDQTEGEALSPEVVMPDWNKATALAALNILEVPFEMIDGNCQGYAKRGVREVAINPVAAMPWKTLFHEIAHCLLHGKEAEAEFVDSGYIDRSIQEAEAEAVAMLCCATLELPGIEESRGYIQHWLIGADRETFLKKSASRVFSAADKILKAGSAKANEASQEGEVGHA
jgi:antirestriction protein ArdC